MIMEPEDRAYCAGLFEGEGNIHFSINKRNGRKSYRNIGIEISMTDREPLDLFDDLMGFGMVYGPIDGGNTRLGTREKLHYRYRVSGFERVQFVICQMWFWLSPRRKIQIAEALTSFTAFEVKRHSKSGQWRSRQK